MNCPFYLEYRSYTETNSYRLEKYWDRHNHDLYKFHSADAITPEISNKIKALKNVCKTNGALTQLINKEFKLNFHTKTIYYQILKLRGEENGKLSDDAFQLMEIIKKNVEDRNSFYDVQISDNEFKGVYFMTQRMISIAQYFYDVFIMDTTHSTNRFNLPSFDIVAINNLGKTTTCFLGLLPDQKY